VSMAGGNDGNPRRKVQIPVPVHIFDHDATGTLHDKWINPGDRLGQGVFVAPNPRLSLGTRGSGRDDRKLARHARSASPSGRLAVITQEVYLRGNVCGVEIARLMRCAEWRSAIDLRNGHSRYSEREKTGATTDLV
jgi:hypothetical protein